MSEEPKSQNSAPYETHQSGLETHYIDDFLAMKGYTRADLVRMPSEEVKPLMVEASRYASMKLAEHEARAKFTRDIRYD
jgi:hypothetical protein